MKQLIEKFVTKKRQRLRICLLLVLAGCLWGLMLPPPAPVSSPALPLSGLTVALDPGHGGYDGGARAVESGLWEKAITLQMALAIEEELTAQGAQVVLTRREDICLAEGDTATRARKRQDLQRRMDIAAEAGADVFLSIHMNEYRSRSEQGPQVFWQRGGEAGKQLAQALQSALIRELDPPKQRQALAGDYYVLRGPLPSALVECGFISNAQEEKLLLSSEYQHRFGQALAAGLCDYLALVSKP